MHQQLIYAQPGTMGQSALNGHHRKQDQILVSRGHSVVKKGLAQGCDQEEAMEVQMDVHQFF